MTFKLTRLRLFFTELARNAVPAFTGAKAVSGSRWFWISLCFCVTAVSLSSESYIVFHQDHLCPGEGCPLCILIQRAEDLSRQLKCAAIFSGFSVNRLLMIAFILKFMISRFIPLSTVQLKVKMNR
jgi:hypothetical protein